MKYMVAENPDLTYIEEPISEIMEAAAAFPKTKRGRKLCDQYSEFLRSIKENGVYDEIQNTWFGPDESKRILPDLYKLPGPNGTVRVAADSSFIPFIYIKDGKVVGIDADMLTHFCKEYGYKAEIVLMDFAGILPAISSGKCDFACGSIAITPERKESVYFSEPTYVGGSILGVLKGPAAKETGGFWGSIRTSFEKTFLRENGWKLFLEGIGNTLLITLLSVLFGILLGFAVYLLCRRGNVVGYIAVQDLTKMGDIVRSRTYEAFFPLIAVTVIYFLLAGLIIRVIESLIGNIDPKNRKPEQILKGVERHD